VVRWRRIDLVRVIEQRFGVRLAERTIGDLPRRLGFRRISVRPRCPEQDAAAQPGAEKNCADLVAAAIPPAAADRTLVAG
jgi:putative transposase